MTAQTRKKRGRASEQAVAAAMRADGWPYAEAVGAGRAGSDVTGTPGVALEVKARRGLALGEWLRQATRQADDGQVPILVVRLDGQGPATVDEWPAVVPFATLRKLLRLAGYGDPPDEHTAVETGPACDPVRADTGTGADFADWLPAPGGHHWLDCGACSAAAVTDTDPAATPAAEHSPRCPLAATEGVS